MGGRSYKYTALLNFPLHWNNGGNVEGDLHNKLALAIEEILWGVVNGSWKAPVATAAALPPTGNTPGDAIVVIDENKIYTWNGAVWAPTDDGALNYQGVWDATNPPAGGSPTLADGVGTKGDYYVVSGSGVQDLGSGPIDFNPGDWAVYNGVIWQKADHTDTVTSVFGRQGGVLAVAGDYAASQITDDSGWGLPFVDDVLNVLQFHAGRHEDGGADELSVTGLSGVLADPQTAAAHRASHILSGSDAFLATDLLDAVVRRVRETDGPTDLLVGDILDGQVLYRNGSTISGLTTQAYKTWNLSFGDNTGPGSSTASATPTVIRYKMFAGTTLWGAPTGITVVLGTSTAGRDVFAELWNETAGVSIATLTTTLTGQNIISLVAASFTNPLPTTAALMSVRIYRGGLAATAGIYDFVLY
jgi:hypothetical protein